MTKRVLIYGINYAPEIAGVGRYTGEIGAYFASQGHDVEVVTAPPHYPGWRLGDGVRGGWTHETLDGAEVYRCPLYLRPRMGGVWRLLAPLTFALSSAPMALWRILRRRPDVVIAVEPTLFVAPLAIAAARLAGARTVLHVQDLEVEAAFAMGHLEAKGPLRKLALAFDAWAMRRFDRVITISNRMAERITAKGVPEERVQVVRNWVDLSRVRADLDATSYRAELSLAPDHFVVLYAGNLGAKQGVRLLLDAAERLQAAPHVVFVIAGDGPMRSEVEAAAERLPNIRSLPFQPEARFGEFLRVADLHVLPQERDAADLLLPSKLGGMLASGRPIVITGDEGTELHNFLGASCRFTPPGDAGALAEAINELSQADPDRGAETQRLARAKTLSKEGLIAAFERSALFLQDAQSAPTKRREAA